MTTNVRSSSLLPWPSRWTVVPMESCEDAAEAAHEEGELEEPWMAAVMSAAHAQVRAQTWSEHGLLSRVCFAKEQLQILKKYRRICARLQRYGAQLLSKQEPLVSVHFPIAPLPNTRVSMAEGISRALVRFCRQLHETTLAVAPERLAAISPIAMTKLVAFVNDVAAQLWDVTQQAIDGSCSADKGKARVVAFCDAFASECIREELTAINAARSNCDALACAIRDFLDKRRLTDRQIKKSRADESTGALQQAVCRKWIRGIVRRGHGGAIRSLRTRRRFNEAMRANALHENDWWIATSVQDIEDAFELMSRNPEDGELNNCVYYALERAGNWLMSRAIAEGDVLRWMEEQDETAACWSSISIVSDNPEAAMVDQAPLLQAPGHLGVFATTRLRLLAAPEPLCDSAANELAGVRMARLLAALLREGHLPLDRLGCDYANRIVVCEYCKYERAVLAIESDTLVPLGTLLQVPYESTIPDLATAQRAQQPPHSP